MKPKNKPTAASENATGIADQHEDDEPPEHQRRHHVMRDHCSGLS